jgi:hypothetical protein
MNVNNVDYKGYKIVASAEPDDTTGLWNGRYRTLDHEGTVVYKSFSTSGLRIRSLGSAHGEYFHGDELLSDVSCAIEETQSQSHFRHLNNRRDCGQLLS